MSRGWRSFVVTGVVLALTSQWRGDGRAAADEEAPPKSEAAAQEPIAESAAPVAEKYNLVYKFQPNQVVRYEVSNETEIKTQVKNETETVRNSSRSKRHYLVKAVNDGGTEADLELSIDWVRMEAAFENPDRAKTEPVIFQSDDPQKHPPQFEHVRATIGKPTAVIRFNDKGRPLEVLKGAVAAATPPPVKKGPKGAPLPPVADPTPETYFLPFPPQPVSVGETWKDRFDIRLYDDNRLPVKITIQRNYKLAEVKEGRAVIEMRTAVLTPVANPAIQGQLIQREIAGSLIFDIERGIVLSRDSGVDNTVVGPFGANSSMHAKSKYRETLLESEITADQGAETGAATK